MKKYITTAFTKIAFLFFVLCTALVSAQTDLPDAPVDEPTAPISEYVWFMLLVAVTYAVLKFRAIYKQSLPKAD